MAANEETGEIREPTELELAMRKADSMTSDAYRMSSKDDVGTVRALLAIRAELRALVLAIRERQ